MIRTFFEEDFDDTKQEPEGWNADEDQIDESAIPPETKAALAFFTSPILEAEYIEPTKAPGTPDESHHPIPPETSNYDHDPANDHSGEEFMKDSSDQNLAMESSLIAACAGLVI